MFRTREAPVMPATGRQILRHAEGGEVTQPLYVVNALAVQHHYRALKAAGVKVEETVEFEKNDVFVLTSTELQKILESTDLCISKMLPSARENIEWVWLKSLPEVPVSVKKMVGWVDHFNAEMVKVGEFRGESQEVFAFITHILQSALKREVELRVPHQATVKYTPGGPFRIYVWSSTPDSIQMEYPPDRIWGHVVGCRDSAYVPKKREESVQILDGKYIVAELFPNALYIHHDVVHRGTEGEFRIFAEILRRCVPHLLTPDAFEEHQKAFLKMQQEMQKTALARLVERSVEGRVKRARGTLERAQKLAALKRQEYFEAERPSLQLIRINLILGL